MDACLAFEHALTQASQHVTFSQGPFAVAVLVDDMRSSPPTAGMVRCSVKIELSANRNGLGAAMGGASVALAPGDTPQTAMVDCVEAVIVDLLTRSVARQMQQYATSSPGAGSGSSAGSATPTP